MDAPKIGETESCAVAGGEQQVLERDTKHVPPNPVEFRVRESSAGV